MTAPDRNSVHRCEFVSKSYLRRPRGFTLVEMMVAVTLVLLIMSMFAQVFQLAGGTITTQRGIAENDQRSRVLQNLIQADLNKRTFRTVVPWARGEDGGLIETKSTLRKGYLYISENDPRNGRDDFLQFTIDVRIQTKDSDQTNIFGRAALIPNATDFSSSWTWNQPAIDDGRMAASNGTAKSVAAEVSYFLRGRGLYRRVLLLRQPYPTGTENTQPGFVDTSVTPPVYRDFFDPAESFYGDNRSFWNDFDYSAFPNNAGYARFHGIEDLSNASVQTQFPLGKPRYRFGHRRDLHISREFDASGNFFGRYTHEETSHPRFKYPQLLSLRGQNAPHYIDPPFNNPFNPINDPPALTTEVDVINNTDPNRRLEPYVFEVFQGGPRRGEDLVMSNVHEFDVKIWDPLAGGGFGRFVDIGGSDAVMFSAANRRNATYGPWGTAEDPSSSHYNNVFDTWYPYPVVDGVNVVAPELDLNNDGQNDQAPFRPLRHTRTSGGPTTWAPQEYFVGDEVFPTVENSRNNGLRFYYRCVSGGGSVDSAEPTAGQWPNIVGGRFRKALGEPVWEAVDNWRPLQAIQITIRFLDPTSDQMRQLTVVHSLVD